MSRTLGTVVRGVRAPIFREGDSVVDITVSTVLNALAENNITARDGDVVAVTESVVARCAPGPAARPWAWHSPSSAATASPCCCGASPWARRRSCCC